jgi:hypothetical protein
VRLPFRRRSYVIRHHVIVVMASSFVLLLNRDEIQQGKQEIDDFFKNGKRVNKHAHFSVERRRRRPIGFAKARQNFVSHKKPKKKNQVQ